MNQFNHGARSSLPFLADLDTYLWAMIRDSIPTTVDCSSRSRQFYELATIVFQEKTSEDRSDILQYVSEWSQLLLLYKHNEVSLISTFLEQN